MLCCFRASGDNMKIQCGFDRPWRYPVTSLPWSFRINSVMDCGLMRHERPDTLVEGKIGRLVSCHTDRLCRDNEGDTLPVHLFLARPASSETRKPSVE